MTRTDQTGAHSLRAKKETNFMRFFAVSCRPPAFRNSSSLHPESYRYPDFSSIGNFVCKLGLSIRFCQTTAGNDSPTTRGIDPRARTGGVHGKGKSAASISAIEEEGGDAESRKLLFLAEGKGGSRDLRQGGEGAWHRSRVDRSDLHGHDPLFPFWSREVFRKAERILDPFPLMPMAGEAVDQVRKEFSRPGLLPKGSLWAL
ncbi:hypothetical protein [Methylacidimicrobium sp. B4]|uniref:hypothetical protein n=1 Tax=Methylacidimicrobium sp. B4 TaxID=2796139 RepID=UPI001A8F3F4A|nr:hypothetical protein [Methylacidimicrobium sp. B4]QSR85165.1 hypothetical protein MacB4_02570 [Methylacidimicrobium sp. B4]